MISLPDSADLLQFTPDASVLTTLDGVILDASAVAWTLFEQPREQMLRKRIVFFLGADDKAAFHACLTNACNGHSTERVMHLRSRGGDRGAKVAVAVMRVGASEVLFWRFQPAHRRLPRANFDTLTYLPSAGTPRVLVVAADTEMTAVTDMVLRDCGASAHVVQSIGAALDALPTFEPGVVIADVGLRSIAGLDFLSELRERNAARPFPASIAVSVRNGGLDGRGALAAGYHAYLLKPVTPQAVKTAMKAVTRVVVERGSRKKVSVRSPKR